MAGKTSSSEQDISEILADSDSDSDSDTEIYTYSCNTTSGSDNST